MPKSRRQQCSACHGKKKIEIITYKRNGTRKSKWRRCHYCHGKGWLPHTFENKVLRGGYTAPTTIQQAKKCTCGQPTGHLPNCGIWRR